MKPPKGEMPAGSERSPRGLKRPAKFSDFVVFTTPKRQPRSVSLPPADEAARSMKSGNLKKPDATPKGAEVLNSSPQKNQRSRSDKPSTGTNQSSKGTNPSSSRTNQSTKESKTATPNVKHPKGADVAVSSNIRNYGRASLPSNLELEKNRKIAENGRTDGGTRIFKCKKCGFVAERPALITRHYNQAHLGVDPGLRSLLPAKGTGLQASQLLTKKNDQKMVKIESESVSSGPKSDFAEDREVPVSANLRNRSSHSSPLRKQNGLEKPSENGRNPQAPAAAARQRKRTIEPACTPPSDSVKEEKEEDGGDDKKVMNVGQDRTGELLPPAKSSKRCSISDCKQLCFPAMGISVHRFPMPGNQMRKHWLTLTNIRDTNGSLYICSKHFKDDDYKYIEGRDSSDKFYRLLKGSAIPTIHVAAGSKVINRIKAEIAGSGIDVSKSRLYYDKRPEAMKPEKEQRTKRECSTSPEARRKSVCLESSRERPKKEGSSIKGTISKERSSPPTHVCDRSGSVKENSIQEKAEGSGKYSISKDCSQTPAPRERRSTICRDSTRGQLTEESKETEDTYQETCPDLSSLGNGLTKSSGDVGQKMKMRKGEENVDQSEPSEVLVESTPKKINGLDYSTKSSPAKSSQDSKMRRRSTREEDGKSKHQNDSGHPGIKNQNDKNGLVNGKKDAKQPQKTANKSKKPKPKKRKSVQSLENGLAGSEKACEEPAEIVPEDTFDGVERQVEFISIDFNRRIMLELQIQSRLKELQRQHEENMVQNGNESVTQSSSIDSDTPSVEISVDDLDGTTEHCGSHKLVKRRRKENVIDNSRDLSPLKVGAKNNEGTCETDDEFGSNELKRAENDQPTKLRNMEDEKVASPSKVRQSARERKVRQQLIEKDDDSMNSDIDGNFNDVDAASVIADREENVGSLEPEVTDGGVYVEETFIPTSELPECEDKEPSDEHCEGMRGDENEHQRTPQKVENHERRSAGSSDKQLTPVQPQSSPSPRSKHLPRTGTTEKSKHHSSQSSKSPKSRGKSSSSPRCTSSVRTPDSKLSSPHSPRSNHSLQTPLKAKDSPKSEEKRKLVHKALFRRSNKEDESEHSGSDSYPTNDGSDSDQKSSNDAQTVGNQKDLQGDRPKTSVLGKTSDGEESSLEENGNLVQTRHKSAEKAILDVNENTAKSSSSKDTQQSSSGKSREYPFEDEHYGLKRCKIQIKRLMLGPGMIDRLQSVKFYLVRRNPQNLLRNPKAQPVLQPKKNRLILPKPVDPPLSSVKPANPSSLVGGHDVHSYKRKCKRCGYVGKNASEITKHFNHVHLGIVNRNVSSLFKSPLLASSDKQSSAASSDKQSSAASRLKDPLAPSGTTGVKKAKTEDSSSESVLSVSSGSESDDLEDKGVSCGLCGYRTETLSDLRDHSKYHTGADFCCKTCGFKSEVEADFSNHLKSHADSQDPKSKQKQTKLNEDSSSTGQLDGRVFFCRPCGFTSDRIFNYNKHLESTRHKERLNSDISTAGEAALKQPNLPSNNKIETNSISSDVEDPPDVKATSIKAENNFNCQPHISAIGKIGINKIETPDKEYEPDDRMLEDKRFQEFQRFYCKPCDVILVDHRGYTRHCTTLKHRSNVGDKETKPIITYVDKGKGVLKSIKSETSQSDESVQRPVTSTLSSLREKRNRKPIIVSDSEKNDDDDDDKRSDDCSDNDEESYYSGGTADDSGSDEDYNPAWEEAKERQRIARRKSTRSSFGDRDKKLSFSELLEVVKIEQKTPHVKTEPKVSVISKVDGQVKVSGTVCTPDVILKSMDPGFLKLPLNAVVSEGSRVSSPDSLRKTPVGNVDVHPVLKQISIIRKSEGNNRSYDKTFTCATCGYRTTFLNSFNKHLHWRGHEAMPEPESEENEIVPKTIKAEAESLDTSGNSDEHLNSIEESRSKTPSFVPNPKAAKLEPDLKKTPRAGPEPRRPSESPTTPSSSKSRSSRSEPNPSTPCSSKTSSSELRTPPASHSNRRSSEEPKRSSTHVPMSPNLSPNPKRPRSTASEESENKKDPTRSASRRNEPEASPVSEDPSSDNSNDMYHLKFIATSVLPEDAQQSSSAVADIPIGCLFCDFKCATVSGLASHMKQHVGGML